MQKICFSRSVGYDFAMFGCVLAGQEVARWDNSWVLLWPDSAMPALKDMNDLICTEFRTVYPWTHPVFPIDPSAIHRPH